MAALYSYKLNPRESWSLINRLYNLGAVSDTRVETFNNYLETFLHRNVVGLDNARSVFISGRPLFQEASVNNVEPFSIVFGIHIENGASISEIVILRTQFLDNIRDLRRAFRTHFNLRLDFSNTEPRIFYGHVIPNIPIQIMD